MSKASNFQIQSGNRLLATLPREEYARLLPHLETVSLPFEQVLYESRQLIEHVYFPNHGVVSLLTILEDGTAAEVGLVGSEGMVGLPLFLGVDTAPLRSIVQAPGDALRMQADVFKDLINSVTPFHGLLQRYTHALMIQTAQSAACNNYHSVEQRCCRWLLMYRDCLGSDQFPLTQKFLSQMLGVRRASITVAASKLQRAGLIHYNHGKMMILNPEGLESCACECYGIVKQEFDRLLDWQIP